MNETASFKEYKEFLSKQNVELERERCYYENVTLTMKNFLENSQFWKDIKSSLRAYEQEYQVEKGGYFLLLSEDIPQIHIKTFDCFIDKTYRKNQLNNLLWPNPPEGGWLIPDNWLEKISDVIRTCFVVKYLDGVSFLVEKLEGLCKKNALKCVIDYEAKDEGYYAAHIGITIPFKIMSKSLKYVILNNSIEIQITTQLQDVIRKLTHEFYEERRSELKRTNTKWQWDYRNDSFKSNYLGHILHYLEGMILDVRDNSKGVKK